MICLAVEPLCKAHARALRLDPHLADLAGFLTVPSDPANSDPKCLGSKDAALRHLRALRRAAVLSCLATASCDKAARVRTARYR